MRVDPSARVLAAAGSIIHMFVYLLLGLPVVIVVACSFTESETLRFPPQGFTLHWYARALESGPFMDALRTSTLLALLATALALLAGTAAAFAIDRFRFLGRGVFQAVVFSPLVIPAVVLGIALLQFLAWLGLNRTFIGLLVGHVAITLPYVVRTMLVSLALFDRTLEQAAMNLRATPWVVMRRITLPLMLPGLLSATVFAFATSFGNVTLSIFLGSGGVATLPVQIFTYVEYSFDPVLAAVSSLVILVTLAVITTVERLIGFERMVSKDDRDASGRIAR